MKKSVILVLALALVAACSIAKVYAWNSSISDKDFEKGTSYSIDTNSHKMDTSFVTEIKASRIAGSERPIIRQTIEYRNLIFWQGAISSDSTISETNRFYQKFWNSEKRCRIKATWKQTNGYANMTASLLRIWDNS